MRQALELALEALELCNGEETAEGVVIYTDKEIATIKEALAQLEQDDKCREALDRLAKYALRRKQTIGIGILNEMP